MAMIRIPIERKDDLVRVVRCKDCKYRYGDKDEPYCSRIDPYMRMRVEDEDFCSWGEKNGNNH